MTTDRLADHWWWRPGWRPGRRMYTWHFTFEGQGAVHALAARYQDRLAGLPCLDLVPEPWLHLTTQGVGFTDEITPSEADAVVTEARRFLDGYRAQHVTLGPAEVTAEAILLDVCPVNGLAEMRTRLRHAITNVLGAARLMESDTWTPHVSIAYSNGDADAMPYAAAMSAADTTAAYLTELQLIVLGRDEHSYEWAVDATLTLPDS